MSYEHEEYFVYLDELRESGRVSMFGASANLQDDFDLDRIEAKAILVEWMQTYSERHSEG